MRAEMQRHILRGCHRSCMSCALADARIKRHEHAHVVAAIVQMARQRACDVCKTAGLGKGRHLGSNERDAHG